MLVKLIRPILGNGWNNLRLVSSQNLTTSSVLFQKTPSGTSSSGSSKSTEKSSKNQQKSNTQSFLC